MRTLIWARFICAISLTVLLVPFAAVAKEQGPIVAVKAFGGTIPELSSLEGLTGILVAELSNDYEAKCNGAIVEWMRRDLVIKELELQQRPEFDPSTREPLGQLYQPDVFVEGVFGSTGDRYTYTIQIKNALSGELLSEISGDGVLDELFDFTDTLTPKLIEELCKSRVGYKIFGTMDQGTVRGTICDSLDKPFKATSPEVAGSWSFVPDDKNSGTFTYKASNVGGVPGTGSGTYRILVGKDGKRAIKLDGQGAIHSPLGTFRARIYETLDLTPIKSCDRRGST